MGGASSSWVEPRGGQPPPGRANPFSAVPDRGKQIYWHVPFTHPCPAAHSVPHDPQLFPSVVRFEHVPAQFTSPDGQPHTPLMQTRLLPHVSEHRPQSSLLFWRLTHTAAGPVPHST